MCYSCIRRRNLFVLKLSKYTFTYTPLYDKFFQAKFRSFYDASECCKRNVQFVTA